MGSTVQNTQGKSDVEESGDLGHGGFSDRYRIDSNSPYRAAKAWRFDPGRNPDARRGSEKTITDSRRRRRGHGWGNDLAEQVGCLRVFPADRAQSTLAK